MPDLDLTIPDPTLAPEILAPLDIQHDTDPAEDHSHARRTPHLGHAILFTALWFASQIATLVAAHFLPGARHGAGHGPIRTILAIVVAYLLLLWFSSRLFPLLWQKTFLDGIHWTSRTARLHWKQLVFLGLLLTVAAQVAERFLSTQQQSDLEDLIVTPLSAWLLAIAGSSLIPAVEEIAFRGFLLPAFAIAYDWLSLKRTPAAIALWHQTTILSSPALLFGTLLSSAAFAAMHGTQLHWGRGPLMILFGVSLVLSAVRLRTRSVACSTLVHAAYNGTLFFVLGMSTHGFRHLDTLHAAH